MNATAITAPRRAQDGTSRRAEEPPAGPALRCVEVVLVDDDIRTSYSMWAVLRWRPGVRVVGAFAPSEGASAVIADTRAHVCLVSAALGWDFIRTLTQLSEAPPVLVYANRYSPELDSSAARAGAEGLVCRYADPDEVIAAIQLIADRRQASQASSHGETRGLSGDAGAP